MTKIGFVILHYNVIEETIKCIESIQGLKGYEHCFVVIVDNASPNNTGEILRDKYIEDSQIKVILRDKNDGFSRGNNEGCAYAIKNGQPDFLVVANNDIVFEQADFCERIVEEYKNSGFAVLGPDIYNPNKKIHQSPMADNPPSLWEVNRSIILNSISLWLYPLIYPLFAYWYKTNEDVNVAEEHRVRKENVCLMGATLIYSKKYFEKYFPVFSPETFFYYEEFMLSQRCRFNNELIVFEPSIYVLHMDGRATDSVTLKREYKRIKFRTRNILKAARIYRSYLLKGEVQCGNSREESH